MYKSLIIAFSLFVLLTMNVPLFAQNSYIAERGGRGGGGFNHEEFNHDSFNRDNLNRGDLNRGDLDHGDVDAAAAYGAAAGAANNGAVPSDPNAAEQNMLYYSGMQSMGQNK